MDKSISKKNIDSGSDYTVTFVLFLIMHICVKMMYRI